MNPNATITIKSRQVYNDDIDDGELNLVTEGEFSVVDGEYKIVYRESKLDEDGGEYAEDVFTTIQTSGDTVSMWRTDTSFADMIFEKGKRHHALMSTDAGVLPLCVVTKSILKKFDEKGGQLRLKYNLEIGGHELSENTILLKIKM